MIIQSKTRIVRISFLSQTRKSSKVIIPRLFPWFLISSVKVMYRSSRISTWNQLSIPDRLTVHCTGPSRIRPYWSSVWNHDLEMDLIDSLHFFSSQFNILRLIVKPDSTWDEKNPKMFTDFLLWPFWCVMRVPKAVLTYLLQCPTHWWISLIHISLRHGNSAVWRLVSHQYTSWSWKSTGGSCGVSGVCVDRPACVLSFPSWTCTTRMNLDISWRVIFVQIWKSRVFDSL